MKKVQILVKTSSGLVPFEEVNLPKNHKKAIESILEELGIKKVESKPIKLPTDIGYYIEKIAKRNRLEVGQVGDLINALMGIQPGAALSILYRAIAMELDLQYPHNHISEVKDFFIISNADGRIYPAQNETGRFNYRNFAAFRTMEDARFARRVVGPLLREFYGGKQKNKRSHKG